MFGIRIQADPDDEDHIIELASAHPTTGIEQENLDSGLTEFHLWFRSQAEANAAAVDFPGAVIEEIADTNWNAAFQSTWQPMLAGNRWFLAPPGSTDATPDGRIRLELRPGVAFGNGDHSTTHLCLALLEDWLDPLDAVLDLGSGAGILLDAARALGAGRVIGCDIDPAATPSFYGSADAIRTASIDLAIVNIQIGVILDLWPEIERVMRLGGRIIFSGVREHQVDLLPIAPTEIRSLNGWIAAAAGTRPRRRA